MRCMIALVLLALLWSSPKAAAETANQYCVAKGGFVVARTPTFNTNGGPQFPLSGTKFWCQFNAKDGSSSISVLLDTLVTPKPTLAALAYYAEVPFTAKCNGGPGSCYCNQLGGTDAFGGINLSGGGWVATYNSSDVLDACIFPDLSSIDAYGLFYHSANIIRGKNLNGRLRYKNPN